MRFPSGVTDQYIYFVAVDSTDYVTRETGLSSFTVYRARNGAAAAAYTTPTVAEVSSANMPGVYSLLLDEDMTIGSGNDSEEVVLHITQASMAPVTIKYELYRNVVTAGETLTVASGIGDADVEKWLGQTVAAVTVNGVPEVDVTHWRGTAAAAPTTAGVPAVEVIDMSAAGQTDVRAAVGLASANLDTQLSTIDDFLDTEVATIVSQTTAANIRAAVGLASANLDTQIGDIPTNAELATSQAAADDATLAAIAALSIPTAAVIADAVWDEAIAGHLTAGTTGATLNGAGSAGDPWSTALPGAYAAGTAGKIVGDNINATISSRASQASLDTVDDLLDTEIAAITTATTAASIRAAVGLASANLDTQLDALPTNAELATSQAAADDATLAAIAALSIPTAAAIADAVWDEDATAHQTQGTFGQAIGDPAADTDSIWALVNTNLDAAVSSRLPTASYTSPLSAAGTRSALGMASANLDTQLAKLDTIDDFLDTEIAALTTAVDALPTNAELATALGTADDAVLAQVALVKAKTDSLTFTVAGVVDANTLRVGGTVQTAGDIVGDTNDIQTRLPAALVSGRMDVSVGAMAANVMTAAAAAADLTTELQSGLATASALTTVAGYIDTEVASILAAVDTEIGALTTAVADLPTNAELSAALAAADDAVLAAIAALNNLSAAQVNAEVVDALATDTYAEPGQGNPASTASLAAKVGYLYKVLRNKSTVTATQHSVFNDDGVTVDHKRTVGDDGTTFTSGELSTGP